MQFASVNADSGPSLGGCIAVRAIWDSGAEVRAATVDDAPGPVTVAATHAGLVAEFDEVRLPGRLFESAPPECECSGFASEESAGSELSGRDGGLQQ